MNSYFSESFVLPTHSAFLLREQYHFYLPLALYLTIYFMSGMLLVNWFVDTVP